MLLSSCERCKGWQNKGTQSIPENAEKPNRKSVWLLPVQKNRKLNEQHFLQDSFGVIRFL
jgi:hypothetical protein